MKKLIITTLMIILFMNTKCYAFKINPAQYIISQSTLGVALSIKEEQEENIVENQEEQQEENIEQESFIDKIINWIKSLFRKED